MRRGFKAKFQIKLLAVSMDQRSSLDDVVKPNHFSSTFALWHLSQCEFVGTGIILLKLVALGMQLLYSSVISHLGSGLSL